MGGPNVTEARVNDPLEATLSFNPGRSSDKGCRGTVRMQHIMAGLCGKYMQMVRHLLFLDGGLLPCSLELFTILEV